MVFLLRHHSNSEGPRGHHASHGDGEEILLSVVRPCGMGVPPTKALNTSGSPHLTIGYLLKVKCEDLELQVG